MAATDPSRSADALRRGTAILTNVDEEGSGRTRRADAAEFRAIFDRYAAPMLAFLHDMVGDREMAEDLTQETFVRAHAGLCGLRDPARLSSWLYGIAKNVAREALRARLRHPPPVSLESLGDLELAAADPEPEFELMRQEFHASVREALATLDEERRAVFSLRVFHDRSYAEIAEITGFTLPKLKSELHRARGEMRRLLRPYLGGTDEM